MSPAHRVRARAGTVGVCLLALLAACSGDNEPADAGSNEAAGTTSPATEEHSFEGETIELVVGYGPGGSFDTAARWLQPYLEDVTGATVVVENMPGAGNLIALNHIWTSEPDGSTIGTLNGPGTAVAVMTGAAEESIQFELTEFSFLAGLTAGSRLMTVGANSPYETFEDLLGSDQEILLGVTGATGSGYNDAVLMQSVFGDQVDLQIVSGFESGAETQLALARGEVDASFSLLGGELPAIEAGEIRGLVVLSDERSEFLPDVPAITEYDLSDDVLELLDIHITVSELGISLVAPPDIPESMLKSLQAAVLEAANDAELIEQAQSQGVNWAPRSAAEIQQAFVDALNAPEEYVETMRAAAAP